MRGTLLIILETANKHCRSSNKKDLLDTGLAELEDVYLCDSCVS